VNFSSDAFANASHLTTLADAVPQIVFIDNTEGDVEYWNARWYEYTGLTPEQSFGPGRYSVVHADDRAALITQFPRSLKAGLPFDMELRMRRASDGMYRWHLSRVVPLRDTAGKIIRWYGTLTDIDDQKRVEETLRYLSDAQNRIGSSLDVETTLRHFAASAIGGFADWCGIYERSEDGGISAVVIAHKDQQKVELAKQLSTEFPVQSGDAIWSVIESGEPFLLANIDEAMLREQVQNPRQLELLLALGLRSAMILPLRSAGKSLGAISLVSSESERVFTQTDLRFAQVLAERAALAWQNARLLRDAVESERRFRTLAETIPAMVWVCEPNGAIRYTNGRWREFFNSEDDGARQWRMRDHVHPDDFERANARWKLSLQTGTPYEVEYRSRNAAGRYEWLLVRSDPLRDDTGAVLSWFGTSTSIDRQKLALERQKFVADTLQEAFIPKVLPDSARVHFNGAYFAAQVDASVGGDWYGATALSDDLIVVSIGDVCGHGIEAAVTMGRVRQAILTASMDTTDPARVLEKVNRLMILQDAPIVTATVVFVDLRANTITFASAGHPPAIIFSGGDMQTYCSGDIPLAVQANATYTSRTSKIDSEMFVVLYTDGLVEARRDLPADELRVFAAAKRASEGKIGAAQIRDEVLSGVQSSDDVAILTMRLLP
jgi:PAS domain S-box-containing protein